jgi:aminopeptidase
MTKQDYKPPQKILEKYADIMVNFALGAGKGIKKGDVVRISANECAKPLFLELKKAVWKAGGHVISDYQPNNDLQHPDAERHFYAYAKKHQISHFPSHYLKGLIRQMDHNIFVTAETDKRALSGVDPNMLLQRGEVMKPWIEWRTKKENQGKFTWTICLYGTLAMAKEAGMSLREYWGQIIHACFLDKKNPTAVWKKLYNRLEAYRKKLNRLAINRLHVKGPDADLWIKIGEKRRWIGGRGANIPSFELFTSPDWRGTEGWIRFNQPLYGYGNLVKGIKLEFKNGKVTHSSASKNEKLLRQMIATPNANKIGEFSLTDRRFSRITRFMAETLFDENTGGTHGNTHIALGKSFHECYNGNSSKVSKNTWERMGFNNSSVHTDIISTAPRIVTAYLKDGTQKVIYKNGRFIL